MAFSFRGCGPPSGVNRTILNVGSGIKGEIKTFLAVEDAPSHCQRNGEGSSRDRLEEVGGLLSTRRSTIMASTVRHYRDEVQVVTDAVPTAPTIRVTRLFHSGSGSRGRARR